VLLLTSSVGIGAT
jgi:hypothetical protein